ncbi:DUF3386 domain-containing protein [Prochlorothrix hollandica]|uniref:DUF3386 domain-containing protein n=1 Tax=Prochlorothrix hollandica TaxID=1223 RepID=UPI00034CAF68|nr:DUF3386 domain-containing protein [Prochlorothrix hollandica]
MVSVQTQDTSTPDTSAQDTSAQDTSAQDTSAQDTSAQDLFRAAYENRYTWDKNFPGYRATVTYRQGDDSVTGHAEVTAKFKPSVTGIDDETARQTVHGQLHEVAIHRVRRTFEETHGHNTFRLGETDDSGALEILMGGKAEGDRYKIRNQEVCLVHRHIHGVVVTINTFSSHDTGAGYLSHRYDSVYHDPQTGEAKGGRSEFEDLYTEVGGYYLLSQRRITSATPDGAVTQEFTFSDFELLTPETA